jgi:RNA recognition motif-containing protein
MTKVVQDRNTKKSLGYGFVKFAREDDAAKAIQRLNGFIIDNKCLKVSLARPASLDIRNCKLYITNLPKDFIENDVIKLFQEVRFSLSLASNLLS